MFGFALLHGDLISASKKTFGYLNSFAKPDDILLVAGQNAEINDDDPRDNGGR